jgi:hypothetical protein
MSKFEIKNKSGSVVNYIGYEDKKVYCEYCAFNYYHRDDCCGEYDYDILEQSIQDDLKLIQSFKLKPKYCNTDDFYAFEFIEKPLCFHTFSLMVDKMLAEHFHHSKYCPYLVNKISYYIDIQINRQMHKMNEDYVLLLIHVIKQQIKINGRDFKMGLLVAIYHKTDPNRIYYKNDHGRKYVVSLYDIIDLYYNKLIIDSAFISDKYYNLDSPFVNKACDYILENY